MKEEETMKEYWNKTRDVRWEMWRFLGGGGIRLSDAWTKNWVYSFNVLLGTNYIVGFSEAGTFSAYDPGLFSRISGGLDLRAYSSWQLLHWQTGFNKRVHSAANHSRDLV